MIRLFHPRVVLEAEEEVRKVFQSGWIGLGEKTKEFEEKFAQYVGAKHAVALNSATSALHLAMIVSGIEEGDEVLTTPMTFISTNHAILYNKAIPVFVDIEPNTLNLDLDKAETLITDKTKAIVVVHYGGQPLNMTKLEDFASSFNLKVIEDAAHACGASFNGRKVGSFNLTCFSFHAVKNLAIGDGGAITTNDSEIYSRLMSLRWLGINKSTYERSLPGEYKWDYNVDEVGFKYHMNDIQAAIGLAQLNYLDNFNSYRGSMVLDYKSRLSNVKFLENNSISRSAHHLCVIKSDKRYKIIDALSSNSIEYGLHYKPNHLYPMYKNLVRSPLVETERAYGKILSLPLHLHLSNRDISLICEVINNA